MSVFFFSPFRIVSHPQSYSRYFFFSFVCQFLVDYMQTKTILFLLSVHFKKFFFYHYFPWLTPFFLVYCFAKRILFENSIVSLLPASFHVAQQRRRDGREVTKWVTPLQVKNGEFCTGLFYSGDEEIKDCVGSMCAQYSSRRCVIIAFFLSISYSLCERNFPSALSPSLVLDMKGKKNGRRPDGDTIT